MPIYEYHCSACGHDFEVIQKMSDAPIRKCESCGKQKAKRAVSRTSFILKGEGWYASGYSSSAPKPAAASDSGASKKASNE